MKQFKQWPPNRISFWPPSFALVALGLALAWPPGGAPAMHRGCLIAGQDITNWNRTPGSEVAPVPLENIEANGMISSSSSATTTVAQVAVESIRRKSRLKDENKENSSSADLTEIDSMTTVVPSGFVPRA